MSKFFEGTKLLTPKRHSYMIFLFRVVPLIFLLPNIPGFLGHEEILIPTIFMSNNRINRLFNIIKNSFRRVKRTISLTLEISSSHKNGVPSVFVCASNICLQLSSSRIVPESGLSPNMYTRRGAAARAPSTLSWFTPCH